MDDATSEHYDMRFVEEEGKGLSNVQTLGGPQEVGHFRSSPPSLPIDRAGDPEGQDALPVIAVVHPLVRGRWL